MEKSSHTKRAYLTAHKRIKIFGTPTSNDLTAILEVLNFDTGAIENDVYVPEDITMDGRVKIFGTPTTNDLTRVLEALGFDTGLQIIRAF